MTYQTRLIIGNFLVLCFFGLSFSFMWDKNLRMDQCDHLEKKITALGNRQDDLLFNYGLYREISPDEGRSTGFRKYIEIKEPLGKAMIERYAKRCKTGYQKEQFLMMLSNYELYLRTKGLLFEESQAAEMLWLRGVSPHSGNLSLD